MEMKIVNVFWLICFIIFFVYLSPYPSIDFY